MSCLDIHIEGPINSEYLFEIIDPFVRECVAYLLNVSKLCVEEHLEVKKRMRAPGGRRGRIIEEIRREDNKLQIAIEKSELGIARINACLANFQEISITNIPW